MCGIAGFVARRSDGDAPERLRAALVAMAHRGPDDEGLTFINPHDQRRVELCTPSTMTGSRLVHRQVSTDSAGFPIGLGHRRFALVDPGPQSHQPFWSPEGKLCLSWDGEIYNHVELRGELAARGHRFETDSDTELFVEAYRPWGTACFERFIGFWAAALFDAERDAVLLTRDRIGKAPLYSRISDQGCYWASELKALRILDQGRPWTVREQSVVDFLYWSLLDLDGSTFFDEVTTFPAASFGWIGDDGGDEILAGYPNEYGFAYLRWLPGRGRVLDAFREFATFPATHHSNPVKNLLIRELLAASPKSEDRIRANPVPAEIDPCTIPRADRRPTPAPTTLEVLLKANVTRRLIPYWTHIDSQNSMGVPIELRSPFLDHRVVELGFRLPVEYLIHRGWTKWSLRLAMQRDLPDAVTWRRQKMGFPFPLAHWLAAGRARLLESIDATPCPYIDHELLRSSYNRLVDASPGYLWRLLSVGLWWQGRG